jgi:hypothetical protein
MGPRAGRRCREGWAVPMHENEPAQARGPLLAKEWGSQAAKQAKQKSRESL